MDHLMSIGGNNSGNTGGGDPKDRWEKMTKEEQDERVDYLWEKARRYNNKLRF